MADAPNFSKLVPGFEFLQELVKNAGSALPHMGQWVAPTLNPEELDKRIDELRTVQFWLEQNARMLGATIQALEVQRMTLSTLKTMNVQMEDLRDSLKIPTPQAPGSAPSAAPAAPPAGRAKPPVDPMQWWGALTQQFTQLAASAMKDNPSEASQNLAKQGLNAATQALKRAVPASPKAPRKAAAPRKRKAKTL